MTSRRRPTVNSFVARHRVGVTFIILAAISVVLLSVSQRPTSLRPERVGQTVLSTMQGLLSGVGGFFSGTWNSIAELRRVREELGAAQQRLIELERFSSDVIELRNENDRLRELLDFAAALPFTHIPAAVVARDPGNLFVTLTINRGRRHGVQIGMPVVALHNGLQGLVGRIDQAGPNTALVQPITGRGSFVASRLQGLRFDGLTSGGGTHTQRLLMRHVSSEARELIQYGDLVMTSGLGGLFPSGLQIGRVREVSGEPYENSLELIVEPLVDFSRLEYVLVIDLGGAGDE